MNNSAAWRALKHRNYRILYPASALSNIGSWAQRVAQDWLVLELTGSPQILGIVTGLQFAPTLFLSLYAGKLADKFDKRKLLYLTNLGAGLASAWLGILIITGVVQIWHVYIAALAIGVFSALDAPVRTSFSSELVGKTDLANAVSLNSANFNVGRLVGPALSGFLILLFGTGPSFLINSLTYVVMIAALTMLNADELHLNKSDEVGGRIRDAVAFIRSRLDITMLMLTVFFSATFGLNYQIFNALMATQEFNKGPAEFGGLGTFLAVGSLSGALIAARLESWRVPRRIMAGATLFGLFLVTLSFAPTYELYSFLLPFGGAVALMTLVSANSYVQTNVSSNLRGRVMGVYLLIFMGGTPIGSPLIGFLAGEIGIRATIAVCGSLTALAAATLLVIYTAKRNSQNSQEVA
ncbi:MAG: MFS transporter [Rhodoluna sp.]|nr:MFS transporter [Rhodoluna sp.]